MPAVTPAAPPSEQHHQVSAVAAALGVAESTITHWIRTRRLRAVRTGGRRYLIPQSAIDQFVRDHPAVPQQEGQRDAS
jgi:excisionase family DNA binding protein